MKYE
jgi:hypothetical protein